MINRINDRINWTHVINGLKVKSLLALSFVTALVQAEPVPHITPFWGSPSGFEQSVGQVPGGLYVALGEDAGSERSFLHFGATNLSGALMAGFDHENLRFAKINIQSLIDSRGNGIIFRGIRGGQFPYGSKVSEEDRSWWLQFFVHGGNGGRFTLRDHYKSAIELAPGFGLSYLGDARTLARIVRLAELEKLQVKSFGDKPVDAKALYSPENMAALISWVKARGQKISVLDLGNFHHFPGRNSDVKGVKDAATRVASMLSSVLSADAKIVLTTERPEQMTRDGVHKPVVYGVTYHSFRVGDLVPMNAMAVWGEMRLAHLKALCAGYLLRP